jgi:hypothetical protein
MNPPTPGVVMEHAQVIKSGSANTSHGWSSNQYRPPTPLRKPRSKNGAEGENGAEEEEEYVEGDYVDEGDYVF